MAIQHTKLHRILIVGSAVDLAPVLEASYEVVTRPTLTHELALDAGSYALVLLSEEIWWAKSLWVSEAIEFGKVVIVFHSEFGDEEVRSVYGARARCISSLWEKDRIVADLEKFIRYSGVDTNGARVLLVDNSLMLAPLADGLKSLGYQVDTESDYESALVKVVTNEPHVVITNSSLLGDTDDTGIRLAQDIRGLYEDRVKVILFSGGPPKIPFREPFGIKLVYWDGGVEKLDAAITESMRDLNLNLSLRVDFDRNAPMSWRTLANIIQQKLVNKPIAVIEAGLKDIVGKLFHDKSIIEASHPMDSGGGNGAIVISPSPKSSRRDYYLVRFGQLEAIRLEEKRFNFYVEPRLAEPKVHLLTNANTISLGGLKFSLSRGVTDCPRDFATFYNAADTAEQVCKPIENLARTICDKDYQQLSSRDSERNDLLEAYREPLKDHMDRLNTVIEDVLRQEKYGIRFKKRRRGVGVTINGKQELFENPLRFLDRLEKNQTIPEPRAWGVTNAGFTARNLFVDAADNIWITDFHNTGPGPALRDFSDLETAIKFELLQAENFADLLAFEKAVLLPDKFTDEISLDPRIESNPEFAKARTAIARIRALAPEQLRTDIKGLYVWLLTRALKMMMWEGITKDDRSRHAVRARYAYLSATLIAKRLRPDFEGWDIVIV